MILLFDKKIYNITTLAGSRKKSVWILPLFTHMKNLIISWILLSLVAVADQRSYRGVYSRRNYATRNPKIVKQETEYKVKRGDLAILICEVRDLGTKTVSWRRIGEQNPITVGTFTYVSDGRFRIQHVSHLDQWNLHIRNVSLDDEGQYECQVSTKERDQRLTVTLDVEDWTERKDKAMIRITGNEYVDKGETITLRCNATGNYYPPQTLDWFKDGIKLVSDQAKHITVIEKTFLKRKIIVSDLQIKKSSMRDAGVYLCRTSDKHITDIHVHVLNAVRMQTKRKVYGHLQNEDYPQNASSRIKLQTSVVLFIILLLNVFT